MIFKPFNGEVNVGYRLYVEEKEGEERPVSKFYWETTNRRGVLDSLEKLSHALRALRVNPEQIDSKGIERASPPFIDKLSDSLMAKLKHNLSRPMIIVLKRYVPNSQKKE